MFFSYSHLIDETNSFQFSYRNKDQIIDHLILQLNMYDAVYKSRTQSWLHALSNLCTPVLSVNSLRCGRFPQILDWLRSYVIVYDKIKNKNSKIKTPT